MSSAVGSAFNQPSPWYEDCVMLDCCLLHALAWQLLSTLPKLHTSVAGCLLLCSTFYKGNQWITSKPDCPEKFQGFLGGEELFLFFFFFFTFFILCFVKAFFFQVFLYDPKDFFFNCDHTRCTNVLLNSYMCEYVPFIWSKRK